MQIATPVMKRLNSFEMSELQRILEAVEYQELYMTGLSKICGGYATAEAYDIILEDDWDDDTGEEVDIIELQVESGEQMGSRTTCEKSCHRLVRTVLANKKMTLKEKLQKIQEA